MGIDLGTTNSCMGIWNFDNDMVEILANDMGKNTTPSWIGINEVGKFVVGERAINQETWIYDAKRMIGKKFEDPTVQNFLKKWGFDVERDDQNSCKILVPGE